MTIEAAYGRARAKVYYEGIQWGATERWWLVVMAARPRLMKHIYA